MNVGLPCTGLGGIFYLVCAFGTLVVQFVNTVVKKSVNIKKWLFALKQAGIASGILGTIWVTGLFLEMLAGRKSAGYLLPTDAAEVGYVKYSWIIIATPFVTLAALLCLTWFLGSLLKLKNAVERI